MKNLHIEDLGIDFACQIPRMPGGVVGAGTSPMRALCDALKGLELRGVDVSALDFDASEIGLESIPESYCYDGSELWETGSSPVAPYCFVGVRVMK